MQSAVKGQNKRAACGTFYRDRQQDFTFANIHGCHSLWVDWCCSM